MISTLSKSRSGRDICRDIEYGRPSVHAAQIADAVTAQRDLDTVSMKRMHETLHSATERELAAEPVNRLFRDRQYDTAADPEGTVVAGRVSRFYAGKKHRLGRVTLGWGQLRDARWVVNGVSYDSTVGELFAEALRALVPARYGPAAVIAHGDAHNANVWFERDEEGTPRLIQFDPAFAGEHVPALLAEVKTTFHNVFAHPFWLYEPVIATDRADCEVQYRDGLLLVEHDHRPGALREAFLRSKADLVWRPLLTELSERKWLPRDWRRIVRLALFCCPTLVHELRAGGPTGHTPTSAAIGWRIAVAAGSEPRGSEDDFTRLWDAVQP